MIAVNHLYKMSPPNVIIRKARLFFGDDVTMDNEKINRRWLEKPMVKILHDVRKRLKMYRSNDNTPMDILRELFTENRDEP